MSATEGKRYVVAWLSPGENASSFTRSCQRLQAWDHANHQRLRGFVHEECGAGGISSGRNSAVRKFLATDADWLVFIDSDMGFDPWAVDQLVDVADPDERPIVGGLCFALWRGPEGEAGSRRTAMKPTVYRYFETDRTCGVYPVHDYPRDSLVRCDATGSAFIAIHRGVFERMAAEQSHHPLRPWYDETPHLDKIFSEDLTFCLRAGQLGIPTHVHTAIKTSHYKQSYLVEAGHDPRRPLWAVVPVKGRNDLTRGLLDDLARDGLSGGLVLIDNGSDPDDRAELEEMVDGMPFHVHLLDLPDAGIHTMWNAGLDVAEAAHWPCDVAVLNNDVRLGPGALDALQGALADDPTLGVVGPNYDGRDGDGVEDVDDIAAGRHDGTGGLPGFAFMFRGESGYRFPEELNWWFGDSDMLLSVLASGMRAGIVLAASCEHVDGGSGTGDWSDPEMKPLLDADREWFRAKWTPDPEE